MAIVHRSSRSAPSTPTFELRVQPLVIVAQFLGPPVRMRQDVVHRVFHFGSPFDVFGQRPEARIDFADYLAVVVDDHESAAMPLELASRRRLALAVAEPSGVGVHRTWRNGGYCQRAITAAFGGFRRRFP